MFLHLCNFGRVKNLKVEPDFIGQLFNPNACVLTWQYKVSEDRLQNNIVYMAPEYYYFGNRFIL